MALLEADEADNLDPLKSRRKSQRIFVFNGDADGLVAQHILHLTLGPAEVLLTGRKRDIRLLAKLPPLRDDGLQDIHVLDLSLRQNLDALPGLLAYRNVRVTWYDHHEPGDPPVDDRLILHVNQAPGLCTAVIVDGVTGRQHPQWAALAAFGDNLPATAEGLLKPLGLASRAVGELERAGRLLNYNAYGEMPGDGLCDAADLALRMRPFVSALDFAREEKIFAPLEEQFRADQTHFSNVPCLVDTPRAQAFLVPEESWARRYAGTWANDWARANPTRAVAILHPRQEGGYLVSLRAPREAGRPSHTAGGPQGVSSVRPASGLASEFPTGGGRALAAGINVLPESDLEKFLSRFADYFSE